MNILNYFKNIFDCKKKLNLNWYMLVIYHTIQLLTFNKSLRGGLVDLCKK